MAVKTLEEWAHDVWFGYDDVTSFTQEDLNAMSEDEYYEIEDAYNKYVEKERKKGVHNG